MKTEKEILSRIKQLEEIRKGLSITDIDSYIVNTSIINELKWVTDIEVSLEEAWATHRI